MEYFGTIIFYLAMELAKKVILWSSNSVNTRKVIRKSIIKFSETKPFLVL